MDSRFGELSRAMRNRAVEICLLPSGEDDAVSTRGAPRLPAYPLDSQLYRFRHLVANAGDLSKTISVRFEHLAFLDGDLLPSFYAKNSKDVVPLAVALSQDVVSNAAEELTSQDVASEFSM